MILETIRTEIQRQPVLSAISAAIEADPAAFAAILPPGEPAESVPENRLMQALLFAQTDPAFLTAICNRIQAAGALSGEYRNADPFGALGQIVKDAGNAFVTNTTSGFRAVSGTEFGDQSSQIQTPYYRTTTEVTDRMTGLLAPIADAVTGGAASRTGGAIGGYLPQGSPAPAPAPSPAPAPTPAPAPSGTPRQMMGSGTTSITITEGPAKFMGLPNPWGYIVLAVLILLLLAGLWFLFVHKKKKD